MRVSVLTNSHSRDNSSPRRIAVSTASRTIASNQGFFDDEHAVRQFKEMAEEKTAFEEFYYKQKETLIDIKTMKNFIKILNENYFY